MEYYEIFRRIVELIKQDRIDEAYELFKRAIDDAVLAGAEGM